MVERVSAGPKCPMHIRDEVCISIEHFGPGPKNIRTLRHQRVGDFGPKYIKDVIIILLFSMCNDVGLSLNGCQRHLLLL